MLEPIVWRDDGEIRQLGLEVRLSDGLPSVFRRRMKQLEAVQRWLAGYFNAVAILLQIPGAAEYRFDEDERADFGEFIWTRDPRRPLTLLSAALGNLEAKHLMSQAPGGANFRPCKLPHEVHLRLAVLDRNGLLNVAADCLDRLLVVPEVEDLSELHGIEPPRRWWRLFGGKRRRGREWLRPRERTRKERT